MRLYNPTSTLNKLLGFQAIFQLSPRSPVIFRTMSTTTTVDPEINQILTYWFPSPGPQKKWFQGGPAVDEEIRTAFSPLVQRARSFELTKTWTTTPRGTLALILLLDQFPRNLYRGSALSYSSDADARSIAVNAIAQGAERELPVLQQLFFYLPLMHHEDLTSQIAALAFYERLLEGYGEDEETKKMAGMGVEMARRHLKCILKFGRFPGRNEALGRELTVEEKEFLAENPAGF